MNIKQTDRPVATTRIALRVRHLSLRVVLMLSALCLLAHSETLPAEDVAAVKPFDLSRTPVPPEIDAPTESEIRAAIVRGVQFMLDDQNPNGSWGSPTRTKGLNIYAPTPGAHHAFRAATTSLGIAGLIDTLEHLPENTPEKNLRAQVRDSVERAETWLYRELPKLRRADGSAMYNVWGHGYSIQALVRLHGWHKGDADRQASIVSLIEDQFEMLQRYESVDGGWGYYDFRYQADQPTSSSTSFVNGAVLVALKEADSIGVTPPKRMVDRAVAALGRQQKPDFSYLYSEDSQYRPMREINRPGGSLGRSQCCNAAMRLWGDSQITDDVVKVWLCRLYLRNGWLDIGRKRPVPHEAWMQVAGYFYYFGHYYAAVGMDLLPEEERAPYQSMLAKLMLDRQESDGSWWDYPLYDYHQPYGTGFVLMTLDACLP
ncbi:putative signal peptide and transmembrane protein [Rhodopirellula islandica]|uniref:Signal peptide and transmembrane protein n=1 Tax=Rhodopirellula islandica TaxID=595434 RepID=A0A0J1B4T0_RHOIS|nr:terpene cyclase/mutase family protein [Rhodopirellula islandica]KLU01628.1 putative signal peptide and transmembrane protein [Rhodopirellula islandica]